MAVDTRASGPWIPSKESGDGLDMADYKHLATLREYYKRVGAFPSTPKRCEVLGLSSTWTGYSNGKHREVEFLAGEGEVPAKASGPKKGFSTVGAKNNRPSR